ncbi:GDSL-type esterase/lipase family protein [uncultured Leuconostoc sp.]|uniref:GDSL-type esterase/lipase family protein n=1 Tax=uncultured Leuconostoc sp. TaxID=173262 RepID=UPI0025D77A47|nr:GDSL-type esterase/lipase family protein [uncultured Leuconostoc sp.]
MKSINVKPFLSPEWCTSGESFLTTQFGACIELQTTDVSKMQLVFKTSNQVVSFAVKINEEEWQTVPVVEQQLTVAIPTKLAHIRIMLRSVNFNSMALWQQKIILSTMLIDEGEVAPVVYDVPYVTFVGDSITAGEEMAPDGNHPEWSYPVLVAEALGKPLNRIAYGGTGLTASAPFQEPTAISALWQVADNIERERVLTDLVIVNYGTNDFNYGATSEVFTFGLRIYLLELIKRFHSAKIILMIPFNGAFKDIYQTEAKRFDRFIIMATDNWTLPNLRVHPLSNEHKQIAEHILRGL